MALDPATIDLATLTTLAGNAVSEHLLEQLRVHHPQVRVSHGYVFQLLLDGPKTVGALAELLGITQQGASKVVLELESIGYVERRPDETDSRIRHVALTAKGRGVIDRARNARAKLEAELLAAVGAPAMKSARRVLLYLLDHTGALPAVSTRTVKPPKS